MRNLRLALGAAALAALLSPASVLAGPPGSWTKVTGIETPARNTDQIGLARTADSVLHVLYSVEPGGSTPQSVLHRAISANAKTVTGPDAVASMRSVNNDVALLRTPEGGLRAFFAGLTGNSPEGFMSTATAGPDGKAWSAPVAASRNAVPGISPVYAAGGISAALAANGAPVSIWGDSEPGGAGMHVGIDPSQPDIPLSPQCCELDPNVALDSLSGQMYAAWAVSPNTGSSRIEVQPLGGQIVTAPGANAPQLQDRTPLTGRIGAAGVYLGFTAGTNPFLATPALWKVGDPKARLVTGQRRGQNIGIAAAPGGRLWLFWTRLGKLVATRTNKAATSFGALRSVNLPGNTTSAFRTIGDGSKGGLDVLVLSQVKSSIGYWHQRIVPGLTLTVAPKSVSDGSKATFKVTDAGDAVGGAKVKLKLGAKTVSGTTAASGQVKVTVPVGTTPKAYTATATKPTYAAATVRVKVK